MDVVRVTAVVNLQGGNPRHLQCTRIRETMPQVVNGAAGEPSVPHVRVQEDAIDVSALGNAWEQQTVAL